MLNFLIMAGYGASLLILAFMMLLFCIELARGYEMQKQMSVRTSRPVYRENSHSINTELLMQYRANKVRR